jgi:hypothetical protein
MSGVRITHIGGPTALIEVGGWRLLTDPTFDPPGGHYPFRFGIELEKLAGPAIEPGELGSVDAVLLSHDITAITSTPQVERCCRRRAWFSPSPVRSAWAEASAHGPRVGEVLRSLASHFPDLMASARASPSSRRQIPAKSFGLAPSSLRGTEPTFIAHSSDGDKTARGRPRSLPLRADSRSEPTAVASGDGQRAPAPTYVSEATGALPADSSVSPSTQIDDGLSEPRERPGEFRSVRHGSNRYGARYVSRGDARIIEEARLAA